MAEMDNQDERLAPVERQLVEKLDRLIEKGKALLRETAQKAGKFPSQVHPSTQPPPDNYAAWHTQSLVFLENLPVPAKRYTDQFRDSIGASYGDIEVGQAILKTVSEDLHDGMLRSFKSLIAAEVFTDFIDMADHLLGNGYKDPAASLTGAVFEDGLRRIAVANDVEVRGRDDLGSLNNRLAEAGVYNRMRQQQLQPWNTLRNNADHGHFDEYTQEDVRNMIDGVRNLLAEHL